MSLENWLRSRLPRARGHSHRDWRVILYTREGCHLCETAWDLLTDVQRRYAFSLTKVNIDADPALVAEHGLYVPVVAVNGKVRFRGVVNAVLLRRLFDGGV